MKYLTALAGLAVLAASLTAPSTAAEPVTSAETAAEKTVKIRPAQLPRGADIDTPHMRANTIVDGSYRHKLEGPGSYVNLDGRVPGGHVITRYGRASGATEIWYVPRDGEPRRIHRSIRGSGGAVVAPGGKSVVVRFTRGDKDRIRLLSLPGGEQVGRTYASGWIDVLAVRGNRALIMRNRTSSTFWYNFKTGHENLVVRWDAWWASPRHNMLVMDSPLAATERKKGCFRLFRLDRPSQLRVRRCIDPPLEASPDGRLLLMPIEHWSGDWPRMIGFELRKTSDGSLVRRFRTARESEEVRFAGNRSVVVVANGVGHSAAVRCNVNGKCVRASRLARRGGEPLDISLVEWRP